MVTPTLRGGSPGGSTHGKPSGTDKGPFVVRNSGPGYWQEDDKAATIGTEAARVHESTLIAQQVQWASGGGEVLNPTAQALRSEAEHNYQFVAFQPKASRTQSMNPSPICPTIGVTKEVAVAYDGLNQQINEEINPALRIGKDSGDFVAHHMFVRRLTPTECLRLQGFPDNWLNLTPPLSDSAKYRMTGNAVAVLVIRWIGLKIRESSI